MDKQQSTRRSRPLRNAHLLCVVTTLCTICAAQARSPYVRCFERFQRHSIDNSQPIAEHFYVTPHECLNRCIESIGNLVGRARTATDGLCKAVVYNHFQHSCRLYEHDGRVVPAVTHPAIGFDLFRRTATTQECAGPLERYRPGTSGFQFLSKAHSKGAYPADRLSPLAKALSSTLLEQRWRLTPPAEWRAVAEKAAPGHFPEPVFPQMDAVRRRSGAAAQRRRPSLESRRAKQLITLVDGDIRHDKSAEFYDISKIATLNVKRKSPIGLLSISIKPVVFASPTVSATRSSALNTWHQCDRFGAFGKTAFYVVAGSRLARPEERRHFEKPGLASLTYNDVESARQCADRCATITGLHEEPIKCASFNYFAAEKRCEIFDGAAEPDGPGRLVANPSSFGNGSALYAEKFCIPVNRHLFDCEENQFFALYANRAIRRGTSAKTPAKIVVGKTVGACLQSCLNTDGCWTVHFDWSRRRCYLYAARVNDGGQATDDDASTGSAPVVDMVPSGHDGSVVLENGCRETRTAPFAA